MAKIISKVAWWGAVPDADRYYVRLFLPNAEFNYEYAPAVEVPHVDGQDEFEVDLSLLDVTEATYDVVVTAVDAAGNESDPLVLAAGAILDFVAPSAPSTGGLR